MQDKYATKLQVSYSISLLSSEPLPRDIVADGQRRVNIESDGLLTRTPGISTPNEYISNIFGFWDDIGWKITFLREHQITFKPERCHGCSFQYVCTNLILDFRLSY
jgi:hypothetical protein